MRLAGWGIPWFLCLVLASGACKMPDPLGGDGDGDGDRMEEEHPPFQISGRICHVIDLRFPGQCGGANLKGVQVLEREGKVKALGDAQGDFVLPTRSGGRAVLEVAFANPGAIPSVVAVPLDKQSRAFDLLIPLTDPNLYRKVQQATGEFSRPETATIVVSVVRTRDPKTDMPFSTPQLQKDVVITPEPGIGNTVYYNTGKPLTWNDTGKTGQFGTAIIYNVEPSFGTTELTLLGGGLTEPKTIGLIPVAADAVTYVQLDLSPPKPATP